MAVWRRPGFIAAVLWCAVLASAGHAIYAKHRSRELFAQLERLYRERDQLNITFGQLQTEQSTFSAHAQVEVMAVSQLHMVAPDPARIQVVKP